MPGMGRVMEKSTRVLDLQLLFSLPVMSDSATPWTATCQASLLQWIMFCHNSPLWSIHLGWPYTAWLIASLSYASPFTMTRQWSMKGRYTIICIIVLDYKCLKIYKLANYKVISIFIVKIYSLFFLWFLYFVLMVSLALFLKHVVFLLGYIW